MKVTEKLLPMGKADRLMKNALMEGVFPGAALWVLRRSENLFFKTYGHTDLSRHRKIEKTTFFDLASLTKPLATTLAVMFLVREKKLALDTLVGTILDPLKATQKESITLENLLLHTSGLPAYRPYYLNLMKTACHERKQKLNDLLLKEPLEQTIGSRCVYSDLGFMMLRWIVETVSGQRLDTFVQTQIYRPLGLNELFFIDLQQDKRCNIDKFAATEICPWRGKTIRGMVHDENAFSVGGIDGHAGLFGTAENVGMLISELMNAFYGRSDNGLFDHQLVRQFLKPKKNGRRALGFDVPSPTNSSAGHFFSSDSIGHLGFTGTSFWIDLEKEIAVVLLTNRVHPSRENQKIRAFRPALHDTVMSDLFLLPQSDCIF